MTEDSVKRKLTAILCADVKGYSRMMGEDEVGTYHTLSAYLDIMNTITAAHHGRVFSSPGDAILAQFTSVVNAVECAVEIQEKIEAKNTDVPEDRKMRFRIGVSLGDVIEKEEQIYGDGVNIAARIEGLADPGGICISLPTFDQVRRKIKIGFEDLGEHVVKNISDPVRVYRVLTDPDAAGKVIGGKSLKTRQLQLKATWGVLALIFVAGVWAIWNFYIRPAPSPGPELPDKPSIAVLPFKNIGAKSGNDYIADGITDTLINSLFQVPQLFVIARNSVYRYKDKAEDIRKVSEQLGVRHVMEGSVQLSGPRLRINVQLIDAITGKHLWAEGYDGEMKDLFTMQDNITKKIITELQVELTEGELARLLSEGTDNIDAYLKIWKGYQIFMNLTKEGNSQARELAKEVIALDPHYPEGYTLLGWTYVMGVRFRTDENFIKQRLKQAEELVKKALELNNFLAEPHMLLSYAYRRQQKWDLALSAAEKAVSITPFPDYLYRYASLLNRVGRPEDAVEMCKRAMKTDPIPPAYAIGILGRAYFMSEQYEKARDEGIRLIDHIEKVEPDHNIPSAHMLMAATNVMLGQMEKARKHVAEAKKINPRVSLHYYEKWWNTKYEGVNRWISALRKAGLE